MVVLLLKFTHTYTHTHTKKDPFSGIGVVKAFCIIVIVVLDFLLYWVFLPVNTETLHFDTFGRLGKIRVKIKKQPNTKSQQMVKCKYLYFNPFTAPACKTPGLKDGWTRLQAVYFPAL